MEANQNNTDRQYNSGVCLANGDGVAKNVAETSRYYEMAVDQGDAQAQQGYLRSSLIRS
jgi:TPR repeat protein